VVKALRYKPEGSGFETRSGKLVFSIYLIIPAALGPGVHLASNRNEYQHHINNIYGSKVRPVRSADNLAAICEPVVDP
jgi:hypothetical protein